jgi:hypothetical protein
MPQDKGYTSIAANTTVNVLSGRLFERVGGRGAYVRGYACGLTGAAGALTSTFIAGSDVLALDQGLRPLATGPIVPEDHVVGGPALPGDPLQWNITNTTGVAIVAGWLLDVENA